MGPKPGNLGKISDILGSEPPLAAPLPPSQPIQSHDYVSFIYKHIPEIEESQDGVPLGG